MLREEEVKVEMRLGSLNLRSGGGDIWVVKESGEEGACWCCRLDGFSGGSACRLALGLVPAGGHLHDNAVGVLGLGLGDANGGSDGRHVDGL